MNKREAIDYLIENEKHYDEWSGVGMYMAIKKVWNTKNKIWTRDELDKLLYEAENN